MVLASKLKASTDSSSTAALHGDGGIEKRPGDALTPSSLVPQECVELDLERFLKNQDGKSPGWDSVCLLYLSFPFDQVEAWRFTS